MLLSAIQSSIDQLKDLEEKQEKIIEVPAIAYNFWTKSFRSALSNNQKTKRFKWSVKQNLDRKTVTVKKLGNRFIRNVTAFQDANFFYAPCTFCLQKIRIGELLKHGKNICSATCEECQKNPATIKSTVGQEEILICALCNLQFSQKRKIVKVNPSAKTIQKVSSWLLFNDMPTPRRHRITYEEAHSRDSSFTNESKYADC